MNATQSFYSTLAPCPILQLRGYAAAAGLPGPIYAYLDYNGPTGTARDSLAAGMLALAAQAGQLAAGQPIVEAGAGAFAAALAIAGRAAGHPVYLAVPAGGPDARRQALQSLDAQLLDTPPRLRLAGARQQAQRAAAQNGWYHTNWLANDLNPEHHRRTTGPAIAHAIARQGASAVDTVVVCVGSGGTVTGVGEVVKAWTNDVRVVAVEPYESQALRGGFVGPHSIPEMGFGLVPQNYNGYVVDNIAAVSGADAARAARQVLATDAVPAAPAAGAALWAAHQLIASGASRSALCVFGARCLV